MNTLRSITIKDVAKLAGVSHATVSRVLNNSALTRPSTREKVLAIVKDLNFTRSPSARSLISGRTFTIGILVLSDLMERRYPEFLPDILAGMATELNSRGLSLALFFDQIGNHRDLLPVRKLSRKHMDGLFVLSLERQAAIASRVARVDLPVVLVNQRIEGLAMASVVTNDEAGGYAATSHLLSLGHKVIGYVEGIRHHGSNADRKAGYCRALEEQGMVVDPGLSRIGLYEAEGGHRAMCELLVSRPDLTAVFVANDIMAVGAYRAIRESGRRIPEDVSIVGFDDSLFAKIMEPALTSVRKPRMQMGRTAALMMLKLIEAGSNQAHPEEIVLPTNLVVRHSTSAPKILSSQLPPASPAA